MATATIVGGSSVVLSLDPAEIAAAQQALFTAGLPFSSGHVITTPGGATGSGFNVFNFSNSAFTLPGGGQAVALTGTGPAKLTGHSGTELLIGNQGNDTINAAGGSGSVIVGDGSNTILLNTAGLSGGSLNILTGSGLDKVEMWGGSVTISSIDGPSNSVFALAGNNLIDGETPLNVHLQGGNDTVTLNASGDSVFLDGVGTTVNARVALNDASALYLEETGAANVTMTGGSNDTVNVSSGYNNFTSSLSLVASVSGGSNTLNLSGTDQLTVSGGVNTFNISGSETISDQGGILNQFNVADDSNVVIDGVGGQDDEAAIGSDATLTSSVALNLQLNGTNDTVSLADGSNVIVAGQPSPPADPDFVTLGEVSTITFQDGDSDVVLNGAATDTVNIEGGTNSLVSPYDLSVSISDGVNTIALGTASDSLTISGGASTISLSGQDSVTLTGGSTTFDVSNDGYLSASDSAGGNIFSVDSGQLDLTGSTPGADTINVLDDGAGDGINVVSSSITADVYITGGTDSVTLTGTGNNIYVDSVGSAVIDAGSNSSLYLDSSNSAAVTLAGGSNDTVYVNGGTGTFTSAVSLSASVTGGSEVLNLSGNDTITVASGADTLNFLSGNDSVVVSGGSSLFNLSGSGNDTISGSVNLKQSGAGNHVLSLHGNDTINLGSGNDTITEAGSATVTGGSGSLYFTETGATSSQVTAGKGSATLLGGAGNDTFIGGIGNASMVGGAGSNVFTAGAGNDTMDGSGSSTNLFNFSSTATSGLHTVQGFVGTDTIHVAGYTSTQVLAHSTFSGGNTVISLDGGLVKITLVGFDLTSSNGHIS